MSALRGHGVLQVTIQPPPIQATLVRLDSVAPGTELAIPEPDDQDVFESLDDTDAGELPGKVQIVRGRYRLPHPLTGKITSFTRVSNIAKTISDTYHLDKWKLRTLAKGMGLRPDLGELAASLDITEDKEELQKLAEQAMEAAGGSVGANMGTALHAYCERQDSGEDVLAGHLTRGTRRDLEAYRDLLQRKGIEMLPEYMERVVWTRASNSVGRLDRIGWDRALWPCPRIVDLKTQKTMDFGGLEIAMQLAMYANADCMWNELTCEWEPMPEVDLNTATVIHLPVGKGYAETYPVPIDLGWQDVMLSLAVKDRRKRGKNYLTPEPDDRAYRVQLVTATSRQELSATYRKAYDAGLWSEELKALGLARLRTLERTTEIT